MSTEGKILCRNLWCFLSTGEWKPNLFPVAMEIILWARWLSRYSDWLRAGRSGDRIPVGARFSATLQTSPGAHPASCTIGTGSFPGVKSGRGVRPTPQPLLLPWLWKGRAIPLFPLWAVRPVRSLSACTRVRFTFTLRRLFWLMLQTRSKLFSIIDSVGRKHKVRKLSPV